MTSSVSEPRYPQTSTPTSSLPSATEVAYFDRQRPSSQQHESYTPSPGSSIVASEEDAARSPRLTIRRPKLGSRKSSGTMIVPRDAPHTVVESDIEEGDVRSMSPRRNSTEVNKLSEGARRDMIEQARTLQLSLQALVDRVEAVKSEHEKLEGGNKFLQSYIGELMQTSKITSSAPKSKSKGRNAK